MVPAHKRRLGSPLYVHGSYVVEISPDFVWHFLGMEIGDAMGIHNCNMILYLGLFESGILAKSNFRTGNMLRKTIRFFFGALFSDKSIFFEFWTKPQNSGQIWKIHKNTMNHRARFDLFYLLGIAKIFSDIPIDPIDFPSSRPIRLSGAGIPLNGSQGNFRLSQAHDSCIHMNTLDNIYIYTVYILVGGLEH